MYLKSLSIMKERIENYNKYPFNIPAIRSLDKLHFKKNVTFFIGENGSGKSTLLEAIADVCGFNPAGGGRNNTYMLEHAQSDLSDFVRLSWLPKMTQGFFLRAESYYNFATHLERLEDSQAYLPYGGKSLHEQSHGESFLSLFVNRFDQKGIYLLDEPEAALSPARQLTFLKILRDLVKLGKTQFIIATHSPIIMAYPDAQIFTFDTSPIAEIVYEETDHYQITKGFLENRQSYLHKLFN